MKIKTLVAAIWLSTVASELALAEPIKIILFGDSSLIGTGRDYSTGGRLGGIPTVEAFPAKLSDALRTRGWDVSITNLSVPGRTASVGVQTVWQIPNGTNLTIVRLGGRDLVLGANPAEVSVSLGGIIDAVHAKGSMVILTRYWENWPSADTPLRVATRKADALTDWWSGFYAAPASTRPEYDSGDGMHLNAAATTIVVARAVPDIERLLLAGGFRHGF